MAGLCSGSSSMNHCVPWSYLDRSTQFNQFQPDQKRAKVSPLSALKRLIIGDDLGSSRHACSGWKGMVTQFQ